MGTRGKSHKSKPFFAHSPFIPCEHNSNSDDIESSTPDTSSLHSKEIKLTVKLKSITSQAMSYNINFINNAISWFFDLRVPGNSSAI